MQRHISCAVLVLGVISSGCGPGSQSAGEHPGTSASAVQDAAADPDSGSVSFEVELTGGAAEGTYQVGADNRCMAIVNTPDAQINVNAFSQDSALRYAQLSARGFSAEDGQSERFVFVATLDAETLRIDTNPDSLVGQSGTGTVSWRVDGRREIVFDVEATADDGVRVQAKVTCSAPSWTGY